MDSVWTCHHTKPTKSGDTYNQSIVNFRYQNADSKVHTSKQWAICQWISLCAHHDGPFSALGFLLTVEILFQMTGGYHLWLRQPIWGPSICGFTTFHWLSASEMFKPALMHQGKNTWTEILMKWHLVTYFTYSEDCTSFQMSKKGTLFTELKAKLEAHL